MGTHKRLQALPTGGWKKKEPKIRSQENSDLERTA